MSLSSFFISRGKIGCEERKRIPGDYWELSGGANGPLGAVPIHHYFGDFLRIARGPMGANVDDLARHKVANRIISIDQTE